MTVSKFLRKKAEEAIDAILADNQKERKIEDAAGFFVSKDEDQPNAIVIDKITKKNTDFFICQQL